MKMKMKLYSSRHHAYVFRYVSFIGRVFHFNFFAHSSRILAGSRRPYEDQYSPTYSHKSFLIAIDNRAKFLTKKVKASYIGYANAQLHKVETHRRWLLDPPQRKPKPEDFGFTDLYKPLNLSEINAFFYFLWLVVRDCIEYLEAAEELKTLLLEKIDYKQVFLNHRFPKMLKSKFKNILALVLILWNSPLQVVNI